MHSRGQGPLDPNFVCYARTPDIHIYILYIVIYMQFYQYKCKSSAMPSQYGVYMHLRVPELLHVSAGWILSTTKYTLIDLHKSV